MNDQSVPIILDTDIGSDIDDAVCLGYLLRQKRCELLGITTVSGQPRVRAAMADAMCRAAGRSDIPIHAGHDLAMVWRSVVQPDVPQAKILPRFSHRRPEDFPERTAVDFLRREIRRRPGEITLLAIGPMTNLALLFNADPECVGLLKRVVLMCGVFHAPPPGWGHAEWNARLDPHATQVVYQSRVAEHLSVGLDVTFPCKRPSAEVASAFRSAGGPLEVVAAATGEWGSHQVIFHDPLAAALIFRPDLCRMERGRVEVELATTRSAGITWFDRSADGPHQVAMEVGIDAFFTEYFSVVGGVGCPSPV